MNPGLCNKCGHYSMNLDHHVRYHHAKKEIPCEICSKVFTGIPNKMEHVKNVHGYGLSCLDCHVSFSSVNYFKKHQKVVHGRDDKYPCIYCNQEFDYKYSLRRHEKSNCKKKFDKTVKCSECNKSFSRKNGHDDIGHRHTVI